MPLQRDPARIDETIWTFRVDPPVFVQRDAHSWMHITEVKVTRRTYSDHRQVYWNSQATGQAATSKGNKRGNSRVSAYGAEGRALADEALQLVKEGRDGGE